MAATGARKAPAPPTPASKPGLVDRNVIRAALGGKDKKSITLKLKKPVPKQTLPGNWKESEATKQVPIINPLDQKTLAAFPTGRPLEDKVDTVQCKHCRRPVLRAVSANHIRECLNKKQEKLKKKKEAKEAKDAALRKERGEKDDDEGGKDNARKTASKGAVVDADGAKKGKKRKIEGDADKASNAKKKKKDETKQKVAKPKGPVDVERQCGVSLGDGRFCARSLTCKSHSMGLKRAVPGRSLPYDMLLAQYQKRNHARIARQAMDQNAPLPDDLEPQGSIDSDEEKEAVMNALVRYRPRPLATFTPIRQQNKYQYFRMKDMLRGALGVPAGGSIFSNPPQNSENMGTARGLALNMMGAPGSATNESFGQFVPPLSAGLDGGVTGQAPNSRRQSSISGLGGPSTNSAGPRQILPGQLPGPGPQRKGSVAGSVTSVSAA
ncbi:SCA7-domain-containing protein [Delitschia confertaspora ATCC 74209]|uniref:SCA7-domain-containing protein n=1 Tax=Delitschia confertaspora ATCC 74209 TaxID=1513339 RepID=A0A9P4MT57_9PLEO|nr:SCA7-domain-containing protein [Delitschia confertaspora ATCC 74209]